MEVNFQIYHYWRSKCAMKGVKMNETFMKEKPVLPLLASMAIPMVISMLVNSLYNIVDSFYVAQIGEQALSALSLVYPIQNLINALAIGFGIGINAAIAFYLGAGDRRKADSAASQGMLLSVLQGGVITAVSIAVMPAFLAMFTSDSKIIDFGLQYSNIAFSFSVVIMISLTFEKIFQAVGRMTITMAALLIGCIANIILDPVLIFGIGPFPELKIQGAALATGIGQALTVFFYLIVCAVRPLPVHIGRKAMRPDRQMAGKLYAVGIPATLNLALPSLLISALNGILAAYSQSYVVILGVYYKLQTFLYLPASGIVQGMRPLIGYNYGAGEMKRVRKIYQIALVMNLIIMAVGTIICLAVPEALIGLFTDNPATVREGALALRIICAGFILSAVSVTSSGSLEGMGKGTPSLIISVCRYVAVIIPAALILSRIFGAEGVWNAFWVTELISAAAAAVVCGRIWKKNGISERM